MTDATPFSKDELLEIMEQLQESGPFPYPQRITTLQGHRLAATLELLIQNKALLPAEPEPVRAWIEGLTSAQLHAVSIRMNVYQYELRSALLDLLPKEGEGT